jgi:hypothetical protein
MMRAEGTVVAEVDRELERVAQARPGDDARAGNPSQEAELAQLPSPHDPLVGSGPEAGGRRPPRGPRSDTADDACGQRRRRYASLPSRESDHERPGRRPSSSPGVGTGEVARRRRQRLRGEGSGADADLRTSHGGRREAAVRYALGQRMRWA